MGCSINENTRKAMAKRGEKSVCSVTKAQTLKVIRDFPVEMTDLEALVLMLAVSCTADVVGLSIDPPMTGAQVRVIIEKYRPYYEHLKKSAGEVLRNILEDSTMIVLGRVRSALCRVPISTTTDVKIMLGVLFEMKRMAEALPKKNELSLTESEADRFELLQEKIEKAGNLERSKENANKDTETEEKGAVSSFDSIRHQGKVNYAREGEVASAVAARY